MSDASGWSFSGLAPTAPSPKKQVDTELLPPSFTTNLPPTAHDVVKPATEKTFAQIIDRRHVAISPQRKLIAIATGEKQIECFRLNGSRAFWHKRSGYANILALSWLKHKDYLQVAWSDGKLELLDTKTGRPARTLQLRAEEDIEDLSLLLLTSTYFQPQSKAAAHKLKAVDPENEAESLISLLHGSGSSPGLFPSAFAWFDIQEELPRLSILSVLSEDRVVLRKGLSDNFIKQDLLDEFGSKPFSNGSDQTVCALSMGVWSDGIVSFVDEESEVLNGSFSILPQRKEASNGSENKDHDMDQTQGTIVSQINHAWNNASTAQAFLAETSSGDEESNHQHKLLLNFTELETHMSYLKQLTFLLRRMQTLSNYILQVIVNIRTVYQGWRRVPGTWINAGNDMLKESKYKHTLPEALYRFAVTGNLVEPLIEWVKEWIAPADSMVNYDRWRVAIHDGYTNILDAIHNCLLPAIDRAAVVQNRLKVLNRMPTVRLLKVDQSVFTRMGDTINILRLLGHATMHFAATESRQFDAFAPWLQNTLQYANAESNSATAEDLIEKLANADFLRVLPYITGALGQSKLEELLTSPSLDIVKMVAKEASVMGKDDITELMIMHRDGVLPKGAKLIPQVDMLYHGLRWRGGVESLIEAAQKEFLHSMRKEEHLSQYQLSRVRDTRSERRPQSSTSITGKVDQDVIYTAGVVAGTIDTLIISSLANTIDGTQTTAPTTNIFAEGNITQTCFVDSNFLLVLLRTQDESRILKMPYYVPSGAAGTRTNRALDGYRERTKSIAHSPKQQEQRNIERTYTPDTIASSTIVSFEHKDGFVPGTLICEEGKMVVLDESGKRLKVYFDLDVVHEEELGMQGNPEMRDGEPSLDYWAD